MKLLKIFLVLLVYVLVSQSTVVDLKAQDNNINLMTEFSLFYEAHKNKQFDEWTLERGFNVINTDPTQFVRYNPFTKMEEIIFYLHDSVATTTEEAKVALADTALYLYDAAVKYDPKKAGYFLARKGYVLEVWKEADPELVVDAYQTALDADPNLHSVYKDRFGLYLKDHADFNEDYKSRAIDIYQTLADQEPNNPLWPKRLEDIVESIDELIEIQRKAWYMDKDNIEKAWKYASTCIRAQNWEKAKEPLEHLTDKSPEVINYWKQLASVYDKLGENDNAINAFKKLIQLQPDGRDNFVNLALVYKKLEQLSVARTYLRRASEVSPDWDYPLYIEASLYEQAVRNCMGAKFEFNDKCVFQLAVNTYRQTRNKGGQFATLAAERINALSNSIPQQEDYFFRKIKSGDTIRINEGCYSWISRTISAP
ncbi:tetratricopeptide repeat protein [Bacteroidota bacterium]